MSLIVDVGVFVTCAPLCISVREYLSGLCPVSSDFVLFFSTRYDAGCAVQHSNLCQAQIPFITVFQNASPIQFLE